MFLTLLVVIQEIGREGILPYSSFVANNQPFHTPISGFLILCLVSVLTVLLTPVGDAYSFMVNCMPRLFQYCLLCF